MSVEKKIIVSLNPFFFSERSIFHCSESETQGLSRKVSSEHLGKKKVSGFNNGTEKAMENEVMPIIVVTL